MNKAANDSVMDWDDLQNHARDSMTDPVKAPDVSLMDEVEGKVCVGATWTRDELYDRGIR